jgi:peptidoglycan/xylan/chitin deacetylase (PgdA/CDA1 family)
VSEPFRVALTFDMEHPDRPPQPEVSERILDTLRDADVRATMFIQGRWAQAYPSLVRRIAAEGHLVGNHSHYHVKMTLLTRSGITSDVRSATRAIREASGVDSRPWFRCPFGVFDKRGRVHDQLARIGYRDVGWNVESHDWASRPGPAITKRVLDGVALQGDGSVVLMHGWPLATARALPGLVEQLRERGASLVTVDQLDVETLPIGPASVSPNAVPAGN